MIARNVGDADCVDGVAGGRVLRVISISLSRVRGSVMEELLAMRQQVGAFNEAHGLRSVLLHSAGWFIQWHEGPVASVEKMLHIAEGDSRHHRTRIVHRSLGEATLAHTLQIVTTHGADKPTDMARRLHSLFKGQAVEPGAQPAELWRQIAAPLYLPAGMAQPPLVRRHVVAITSEYTGAVDMVRMFSDRFGLPVTYQRFATGVPNSADVGAAYVDLPGDGEVTRLHALSRRSLAYPMVRMMMSELNCVLLLLGERADAACALAQDVYRLVESLAVRPALRLASGGAGNVDQAREQLGAGRDIAEIDLALLWKAGPEALFGQLLNAGNSRAPVPASMAA